MIRKLSSLYVLLFFCPVLLAQTNSKNLAIMHKVQSSLDSLQRANGFPGATFAAVLPDGSKIAISSGVADSLEMSPMSPEARMLSGSNGKTFFAASALAMASKGLFDLDDRIEKYIGEEPWFHRLPNATQITIRMLMNHSSGIMEYYQLGDFMERLEKNPSKVWEPMEILAYVFDRDPLFPAGEKWGYADTNYILLGYIMEKIAGKKMYELIDEEIVKPYNLHRTEPSLNRSFDNLAVGYSGEHSPFPFHGAIVANNELVFNPQFEWAGGGFVSNVKDLARWMKIFYNLPTISEEKQNQMKDGIPAGTGKNHSYGLGLQIRPSAEYGTSFGHSGWFPGYITDAAYFPEVDVSLGIQFNTDDSRYLKMSSYEYLLQLLKILEEKAD